MTNEVLNRISWRCKEYGDTKTPQSKKRLDQELVILRHRLERERKSHRLPNTPDPVEVICVDIIHTVNMIWWYWMYLYYLNIYVKMYSNNRWYLSRRRSEAERYVNSLTPTSILPAIIEYTLLAPYQQTYTIREFIILFLTSRDNGSEESQLHQDKVISLIWPRFYWGGAKQTYEIKSEKL